MVHKYVTQVSEHNLYELFRLLFDETAALDAPAGALQVQAVDEVSVSVLAVKQLVGGRELRHFGEQRGLVQRPAVASTRRLHYRCQVRLRNVKSGQPHHLPTNNQSSPTVHLLRYNGT